MQFMSMSINSFLAVALSANPTVEIKNTRKKIRWRIFPFHKKSGHFVRSFLKLKPFS